MSNSRELCCLGSRYQLGNCSCHRSPGAGDEYKVRVQFVERGIVPNRRRSDLQMRSMAAKNGMSKVITAHFYTSQGRITNSDLLPPLIP